MTSRWHFHQRDGYARYTRLSLTWELRGDPITDDYMLGEISARELWDIWVGKYAQPTMPISWFVEGCDDGVLEFAPLQEDLRDMGDFLFYYSWPVGDDGDPLRWTALPVADKLWERGDKGGFIQTATGWKPSPLQQTADIARIARAARLPGPHRHGQFQPTHNSGR